MAIWLDFSTLVDISNLAVISQYASTCLAVIWLRLKAPQLERRFRVPGGLVLPLAALGVSLWLIKQVRLPEVVFTVSVVLVGVALALLTHALERRRAAT
jgi:APA family basic amino acid/polyamine antiporter